MSHNKPYEVLVDNCPFDNHCNNLQLRTCQHYAKKNLPLLQIEHFRAEKVYQANVMTERTNWLRGCIDVKGRLKYRQTCTSLVTSYPSRSL